MRFIVFCLITILPSCVSSPPAEPDPGDAYIKQASSDIPREYSSVTVSKVERRDKNLVTTFVFFDNQPVTIKHLTVGMTEAGPIIKEEHRKICNDKYFLPLIALGYTFSVELVINPKVKLLPLTEENCIKQGYLVK